MPVYSVCDLVLSSNVALPELSRQAQRPADCTFELLGAQPQPKPDLAATIHQWLRPDGEVWLSIERRGGHYRLHYPNLADFEVEEDGSQIRCTPDLNCASSTLRHLLLDQVLPLVLNRRGRTVLHASAVAISDFAIAFVAPTGQGKSTLAAGFALRGFPLLTDDWLALQRTGDELYALPTYPSVRLWDASVSGLFDAAPEFSEVAHYTEKKRINFASSTAPCCDSAVPVRKFYFLHRDDGGDVEITPCAPRESVMELVKNTYELDITDRVRLRSELELFGDTVLRLLTARLTFPGDFGRLNELVSRVLDDLGQPAAPTAAMPSCCSRQDEVPR